MFARCLHFCPRMLLSWDTHKHILIGPLPLLPSERGSYDAEGKGGELRALSVSVPQETRPAGPTNPSLSARTVSPPLQPSLWWEHWQSLVDNWKLQSTESNYPEQDFPNILRSGVVLFASSICPRFRNILLTHLASLCPLSCFALMVLMLHRLWMICVQIEDVCGWG